MNLQVLLLRNLKTSSVFFESRLQCIYVKLADKKIIILSGLLNKIQSFFPGMCVNVFLIKQLEFCMPCEMYCRLMQYFFI